MNRFIFVVAALLSVACAAELDWRVVGGIKADVGQFPYQVSLRQIGSHFCGGSILNEEWVLTAAHCVVGMNIDIMTVFVGTNKLNAGGDRYRVARAVVHSDYDINTKHNDIALLKINGKILIGGKVQSIPLETSYVGAGEDLVLSGWGRTSYPGNIPNDLQFLKLKSITSDDCNQRHTTTGFPVDSTQLCTLSKRGQGACHGDSGGPLVHDGKLAGVVSWARPCAIGFPDVYTRTSFYVDWINSITQ